MFELNNKIRIFFFILSMILSLDALEISILDFISDFKCKTKIITERCASGSRSYVGTAIKSCYYEAYYPTSKIIAYIVDERRFEEIANPDALGIRTGIAEELGKKNYELVVFGIKNFQQNQFNLIGVFLFDIIKPHPNRTAFQIVTMGEECFDQIFLTIPSVAYSFENYKEESRIYDGKLQECLRNSFPKMEYRSKRPDPSNIKEVRFYENLNCTRKYTKETRWPVFVENGEYMPSSIVNFNRMEHNFMKRYRDLNVHILIVSGKHYNWLTTDNENPWFEEMKKVTDKIRKNNEMLYIMGCFNFDWSEMGIVSQIILAHSEPTANSEVFTAGIGMFDTIFDNPNKYDVRKLQQSKNSDLIKFIEKLHGGTIPKKTIKISNLNASNEMTRLIDLSTGQYKIRNYDFTSQNPNGRFAFIVIDSTEMYNLHVPSVAQTIPDVISLQNKGIELFLIELNNFELYDLHIIPEWIESNRGTVPPNRIAILGGGSFSTTFQFMSPEYQITYALFNVANELKEIRKAFVTTTDNKGIILANINDRNFYYPRFTMHSINGFYDPVVLSEFNMIKTVNNTKILFLIMSANKFNNMINVASKGYPTFISDFRQKIAYPLQQKGYPFNKWAVHLVGLDNFGQRDLHLFAEFVKVFTNDVRPLREFVYTFGDDIYQSMYEYRDTLPFFTSIDMPMVEAFAEFFNSIPS